jgi:class 3 adenylate cyclase
VALVSVLLLTGVNYVFARLLITESVEGQLEGLLAVRSEAIEGGAERTRNDIATIAGAPSVAAALEALSAGYAELGSELTDEQLAELEAAYEAALAPLREVGQDVPDGSLLPSSDSGRSLQYRYLVENPNDFDDRDELVDAGDGSAYSAAHATYHPLLRSLMENAGMSDLMLLDRETGEIVYSVKKRADVGTHVGNGPWADSALGEVVAELSRAAVGDTVLSDSTFYVPARGQAMILMASVIRSGAQVTGAIVTELPVDLLTAVVTSEQDWDALGLGDTGDIYLVGEDGTLRTDPRAWLDDPDAFVEARLERDADDTAADRIRLAGSPALTQRVDNAAVEAALAGDTFVGSVTNFDGERTFAAAGPVRVGNQTWAVVVEQRRSDALAGLRSLLRSTFVVIAILLPITALLGWWMARSMTRPFRTLVDGARRMAHGEPAPELAELGNNELGDVGRQLGLVAARLEEEAEATRAEEEQINDVLGAVVPPRLIERVRQGEQRIDDLVDTATAAAFLVDGVPEATGSDQDVVVEFTEHLNAAARRLQESHGLERVQFSSINALFVAGLGRPDACVDDAARFAVEVVEAVAEVGAEFGQVLTVRAGLAAGDVASGVLGQQQLTFSVWGEPVTTAFTLAALARPGEILVDAAVHDGLASTWETERRDGLPGLDEDVVAWSIPLTRPADRTAR